MTTLGQIIGEKLEEEFASFDLTEIQDILSHLHQDNIIDIAHAEMLQQKALWGADILSEYLGKMVKTVSYLETRANVMRNQAALNYNNVQGKTTADMRKYASESDPLVEEMEIRLGNAKGAKVALEKKYDIIIKFHHYCKEISSGIRKSITGPQSIKVADGWE